jgi:hypothetical protein
MFELQNFADGVDFLVEWDDKRHDGRLRGVVYDRAEMAQDATQSAAHVHGPDIHTPPGDQWGCNSLLGLTVLQNGSGGGPGVAHAAHPALPDMQRSGAHGGVLPRGVGVPVGLVQAEARARRVTQLLARPG